MAKIPTAVDQATCAVWLGLSVREVAYLVKDGLPRQFVGRRVVYPWPECAIWYQNRIREQSKTEAGSAKAKIVDLQQRKLELEVQEAELAIAQRVGTLVSIDYLEEQVTLVLQQLRSKLRNVPGQYATQMVGIKTVGESQIELQRLTTEILTVLADSGGEAELDAGGHGDGQAA